MRRSADWLVGLWRYLSGRAAKDRIAEIGIDDEGRIYIVPQRYAFPTVHQQNRGVLWDPNDRRLYSPACRSLSQGAWFREIVYAARSQGVVLEASPATVWTNVPESLRPKLEAQLGG